MHRVDKARHGDRTLVACNPCKRRKQKCDASIPKCRNCIRGERDCLVEDPTTGRLQPRNYTQRLEERVAMLEEALRTAVPELAQDHLQTNGSEEESQISGISAPTTQPTSHDTPTFTTLDSIPPNHVEGVPDNASEVTDLTSGVALLCLNATGREPHYFGPSSALSFSRILSASLHRSEAAHLNGFIRSANDEMAEQHQLTTLPSRNQGYVLCKAYFDNIQPQYPFLHRPTFTIWQTTFLDAQEQNDIEHVDPVAKFFVLMVYAIGSLLTTQGGSEVAEQYYIAAQEHIEYVIQLNSLESIQVLLCCATYSLRAPVGASVWRLSGMALRHCVELGYHRNIRRGPTSTNHLRLEMAKRVFWVAYDMDRAAAFILGCPFGLTDQDIDCELPLDIDDEFLIPTGLTEQPRTMPEEPATTMSGAIHTINLRRIWSKIRERLYPGTYPDLNNIGADLLHPTVTDLRTELDRWYELTPTVIRAQGERPLSVFTSRDWFNLAYSHSVLLLYRRHINPTTSKESDGAGGAYTHCAQHARKICLLYRKLYSNSTVRYTWGAIHIVFLAGATYLHCLWSSKILRDMTRIDDVYTTCTACTMVLVTVATRWEAAVPYRNVFEALASRTTSMMCSDLEERGTVTKTASSIYTQSQMNTVQEEIPPGWEEDTNWIDGIEDLMIPNDVDWFFSNIT